MSIDKGLEKKKRLTRLRALCLLSIYLLMTIHIVHWLVAKKTLAPLEFNEVLYTVHLGIITAGFIFMALTALGTLIFGRFFCSWACHILALEDLSSWILGKLKIKPAPIRSRAFFIVPVASLLYLFVWPQIERLMNPELYQPYKLKIVEYGKGWASFWTDDFWRNLPSIPVTLFTFFAVGFVIVYVFGSRSYCRFGCPYGVVFGFADRFAPGKIKLTGNCTDCGICTAHCQSHILVHKEVKEFGKVIDTDCLKDLDCIKVCPENALQYKFTKPTFFKNFLFTKTNGRGYSFSLAEDITMGIFTLIFIFIFRGLYDIIPFLLAVGLGVIISYFIILFFRLFSVEYVHIGKTVLRKGNKTTSSGKFVMACTILVLLFSAQSAVVHYHTYQGEKIYNQFVISDSSFVAANGAKADLTQLDQALYHLEKAESWGLWNPLSLNRELASIYISKKNYDEAITHLQAMIKSDNKNDEARMRLAKIFFLKGKEKEATDELGEIIKNNETGNAKAEAHLMLGHIEEKNGLYNNALNDYEQALLAAPSNAEAMLALGVFYTKTGKLSEAEFFLLKCDSITPNVPLIQNNLGLIYLKTKRDNEAVQRLMKLNELQPENFVASYNVGALLFKHKQNDLALTYLEKSIQVNPNYRQAQIILADLLDSLGRKDEAAAHRQIANSIAKPE